MRFIDLMVKTRLCKLKNFYELRMLDKAYGQIISNLTKTFSVLVFGSIKNCQTPERGRYIRVT
jgi:hypothetical protein